MGAIAGEEPSAVLEVTFDGIVAHRRAGLVGVRLLALRASSGEAVLGGSATSPGDLRLELTCDAGHLTCPVLIVRSFPAAERFEP